VFLLLILYALPKSVGQKSFDSVYWKGDTILLFDMTVSHKKQYSINGPGVVEALKAIDKPSTACVQLCFVVPKEKFDDFRLKSYCCWCCCYCCCC